MLVAVFLTIEVYGNWNYILPMRIRKVTTMILVAGAVATSTVLFQTITNNRILTPSLMGFDALYVALNTGLAFAFGGHGIATLDAWCGCSTHSGSAVKCRSTVDYRRTVTGILVMIAILVSVSRALVGGQLVLERVFEFDTSLSVIIEFLGGIVIILLLVSSSRGVRR